MEEKPATTPSSHEQSGGVAIDGQQVSVGRDVAGGDVVGRDVVGRDVVGRDVVGRDAIGGDVVTSTTTITHTGLSAAEVQRLVITVGVLVFVTAACFFSGGVYVGGLALDELNRPVKKTVAMADEMDKKLNQLADLNSGQTSVLTFTEAELSSYVWHDLGPQIGLKDADVRFLGSGHFVIGGYWEDLNNSRIAVTFRLQDGDAPIKLERAAMQVLPLGASRFGWVPISPQMLQPLQDRLNRELDNVTFGPIRSHLPSPMPRPPDHTIGEPAGHLVVEWSIAVTGK